MTHTLFRKHPLPKASRSTSHPHPRPDKQPFFPPLSINKPTPTKDKSPMQQYSAQIIPDPFDTDQTSNSNLAVSADSSESETESSPGSSISSSDSEKSYADITRILMAQPDDTEPAQSSRTDPFFEGRLEFIVNDSGVRCGKPLVYLVLSPKEICVWMLEVWLVNNEHIIW